MKDGNQKGDGSQSDNLNIIPINDVTENNLIKAEPSKIENEKYDNDDDSYDRELPSSFIHNCLQNNQMGDGELFKALHRNNFLYCDAMKSWLRWAGHHWEIDRLSSAEAAVEDVAKAYEKEAFRTRKQLSRVDIEAGNSLEKLIRRLERRSYKLRSHSGRKACLKYARTSADPMAIEGVELDCKPWLLACKNGVIDLKSNSFRPGRREDLILKASPLEWQGFDADKDIWIKTVTEIMDVDELMVEFLQRLFGMAIVGKVVENVFPVLTGFGGENGRSTIIKAVAYVLGSMAGPIPGYMLVANRRQNNLGPSIDVMKLKGLRVAYASEVIDYTKISEERVNLMTSKSPLAGRWPNKKSPITFEPTHTLFFLTNHRPSVAYQDKTFRSRTINIPFSIRFLNSREPKAKNEKPADIYLDEKLLEQASGILAWLVEGCLLWQKNGLQIPFKIKREDEKYRSCEDNMSVFVDQCCLTGPEDLYEIGASQIYAVFFQWWKHYVGNHAPKMKRLGMYLKRRFTSRKVSGYYKYFGLGINWEIVDEFLESREV
jgi:putative DNA primase/helicase